MKIKNVTLTNKILIVQVNIDYRKYRVITCR